MTRMRTLALVGLLAAAALAGGGEPKPRSRHVNESPDIKDVEVKLSVSAEVWLTPARERGGPVATFTATVTIKNTGSWDVPFRRHYLGRIICDPRRPPRVGPVSPEKFMRWHDEPDAMDPTTIAIHAGQTYTTTMRLSFLECAGQPRRGETFVCTQLIYGHRPTASFTIK
jgi:hypothetical protein